MPENQHPAFKNDREYLQSGIQKAQKVFLANKHHEQIFDRIVTHPGDPDTLYHLKRIQGEIAYVHHPHPSKQGHDPEKEYQFPVDELYVPTTAYSIAMQERYLDEQSSPKWFQRLIRFVRGRL